MSKISESVIHTRLLAARVAIFRRAFELSGDGLRGKGEGEEVR
jgi:hypothetical protein